MLRIEMLDENERHAGIGRQAGQELRERFEPSGRGSDTDDWKRRLRAVGRGDGDVCWRCLPRARRLFEAAGRFFDDALGLIACLAIQSVLPADKSLGCRVASSG